MKFVTFVSIIIEVSSLFNFDHFKLGNLVDVSLFSETIGNLFATRPEPSTIPI
jgi:hypothetical protein